MNTTERIKKLSPKKRRLLAARLAASHAGAEVGGPAGEQYLVAYVVPEASNGVTAASLRDALGTRLPDYMIPGPVVFIDSIPLTPIGKVDRKALPEPHVDQDVAEIVAPRTETEREMAGLWRDVLGIDRVGMGDNFFNLGGHSLLATQLVSRIRRTFHIDVSLGQVFDTPTVERLAACVDAARVAVSEDVDVQGEREEGVL